MGIRQAGRQLVLWATLLLSSCTTMPTGPGVLVLPAPGKPLEVFQVDDSICRKWAGQQIGMSAQEIATDNTVRGAAVGTAIGAGAGALLGAASGDAGTGAAIGAGSGLLMGTASGAGSGQLYGMETQERYDYAYVQCMYTKGNQIPGQVHRYRLRTVNPPATPNRYSVPPDYRPE